MGSGLNQNLDPGIIRPSNPEVCPLCGGSCGEGGTAWDIHMILQHPETRPQPVYEVEPKKRKAKKK